MSEIHVPNESAEYREARTRLLAEEKSLVEHVKHVAELRRQLPPGGKVDTDYTFARAFGPQVGQSVRLSELFGDKDTLLLYSFMYGPNWDNPCPSCTSIMDGFDRAHYSVTRNAAFAAVAKAPVDMIKAWAEERGWDHIDLLSGADSTYQADYGCQGESDDMQYPVMHVFHKSGDEVRHFWRTELSGNHLDTVWAYWNLMDLTPEGRPDTPTPPQPFRSRFLEDNYINKD